MFWNVVAMTVDGLSSDEKLFNTSCCDQSKTMFITLGVWSPSDLLMLVSGTGRCLRLVSSGL